MLHLNIKVIKIHFLNYFFVNYFLSSMVDDKIHHSVRCEDVKNIKKPSGDITCFQRVYVVSFKDNLMEIFI